MASEIPKSAWLVSKMGRLTVGVQYEPECMSTRLYFFFDIAKLVQSAIKLVESCFL